MPRENHTLLRTRQIEEKIFNMEQTKRKRIEEQKLSL
jgi:hypothetical protein